MTDAISTYLKYINLQMTAESTQIGDGYAGAINPAWLTEGNKRSSRTPDNIAKQVADQWEISAHVENTKTGLSATLFKNTAGEFVMSIRSTEFLDDSVRDAKVADDQEIRAGGFALGQLSDLDNWCTSTVSKLNGGKSITVTGYSHG